MLHPSDCLLALEKFEKSFGFSRVLRIDHDVGANKIDNIFDARLGITSQANTSLERMLHFFVWLQALAINFECRHPLQEETAQTL